MPSDFSDMAGEIIAEFGEAVSIKRVLTAGAVTATGKRTETTATYSVTLERGRTEDGFVEGVGRVRVREYTGVTADVTAAMGGSGVLPDREDLVVDGTAQWKVLERPRLVDGDRLIRLRCYEFNGAQ